MILQNIVFGKATATEQTKELYYRGTLCHTSTEQVLLEPGDKIWTDTYMNLLDLDFWKSSTRAENYQLHLEICGTGTLLLYMTGDTKPNQDSDTDSLEVKLDFPYTESITIPIPLKWCGKIGFSVEAPASSKLQLHKAFYAADLDHRNFHSVKLAIVICTYKRNQQLSALLEVLFMVRKLLPDSLEITVVDNASELSLSLAQEKGIHLFHNPNTGGCGGFTRGMEEVIKNHEVYPATHLLLMDDDVILNTESIFRLHALLSGIREEYQGASVAGRMFRMDTPWIQYTAAEIWNGGDIRHIGWNQDMTAPENLTAVNDNTKAEYGGWWFNCIPYSFVEKNRPFPFFLHCDDVEYGLRNGHTPLLLNGIQVWHETYEYRKSPVISYYDMRNSLTVNRMYGYLKPRRELHQWWRDEIGRAHAECDYRTEFMLIIGMWDFLKGDAWLKQLDSEKHHIKIRQLSSMNCKLVTAVAWRLTDLFYQLKIEKILACQSTKYNADVRQKDSHSKYPEGGNLERV